MVRVENERTARTMLLACPNCTTTYDVKAAVVGENGRSLRCARCQHVWFATRSQELVFAARPTEARFTAEPEPESPPPPFASENSAGTPLAPDLGITSPPTSPASSPDASNLALEAPPLVPGTTPSPSQPALNSRGEDIETFARRQAQIASTRAERFRAQFGPPAVILLLALCIMGLIAWRTTIVRFAPQTASFYAAIGLPVNLRELVFSNVRTAKETRDGVPVLLVDGAIVSSAKYPVEVPRIRFSLRNAAGQEIYSWTAMPDQSILAPGATLPFRSRLASPPSEGHEIVVRFFNRRDAIEGR